MINRDVRSVVSLALEFLREFNRGLERGFYGDEPHHEATQEDMMQAVMMVRDPNRVIRPFAYHMGKYFDGENFTRSEVIENMTLSLESLTEEIKAHTPESTITSRVERDKDKDGPLVLGHIDWQVDIPSPKVYAISMDLLKDGFMYRTDSKTFVITGRVPE